MYSSQALLVGSTVMGEIQHSIVIIVGTGKSVLLRQIIGWARKRGEGKVGVTASTGMAAVNIGGITLHSWAGIGLGNEQPKHYANAIKYGPVKVYKRWLEVETLIIDESNVHFLCFRCKR